MRFLDVTLPTVEENLALDDVLLHAAEAGSNRDEVLRFWELPHHAVVVGSACRVHDDVVLAACRRDGIPIVRRSSGGGTVLVGPGCLNLAIVLRYERSIALSTIQGAFTYVLDRIQHCLRAAGVSAPVRIDGTADLCQGEQKVGGSAQRRRRHALLYHGTLLYRFDLSRVSRYLAEPARQPAYRAQRQHGQFLTNVAVDPEVLKRRMGAVWEAKAQGVRWRAEEVVELAAAKYADGAWTFRR